MAGGLMSLFTRYTPAKVAKLAKPRSSLEIIEHYKVVQAEKLKQPSGRLVNLTKYEQNLVDEVECREDFCSTHRKMLGGSCPHYNVTKGIEHGDRIESLDNCLLWILARAGPQLEPASAAGIVEGVTVGNVIKWVAANDNDLAALRKERRLILTCAEALQKAATFQEKT